MIIKHRSEPRELKLLRALNIRKQLSVKESYYYSNLEKGFEGEQKFDGWLDKLSNECLILNDLLFEINNSIFQVDSTLISPDKIYLFEVKNFEGDYYIADDKKWYKKAGTERKNPLLQLQRNETLFQHLLQSIKSNTPFNTFLTFVNPNFYLYQAPLNMPIIFPTQIDHFFSELNANTSKLKDSHWKLAD